MPSVEEARLHGVSNLNAFGDGGRVLRTILVEFRRHRQSVKQASSNAATTELPVVRASVAEAAWESKVDDASVLAGATRMTPVPAAAATE